MTYPRRTSSTIAEEDMLETNVDTTSDDPAFDHHPAEEDSEPRPLGQEAPEVIEDASKIGSRQLKRSIAGTAITALIGGMSVSFGEVPMAWAAASVSGSLPTPSNAHLASALFFPIGFTILLVDKSEFFTNNWTQRNANGPLLRPVPFME